MFINGLSSLLRGRRIPFGSAVLVPETIASQLSVYSPNGPTVLIIELGANVRKQAKLILSVCVFSVVNKK